MELLNLFPSTPIEQTFLVKQMIHHEIFIFLIWSLYNIKSSPSNSRDQDQR